MAREAADVTVIIPNSHSYGILNVELQRVGAARNGAAHRQLDLSTPPLDFVSIASGMGVPAVRPTTARHFAAALKGALGEPGPHLIEAVIPQVFTGRKLKALPTALRAMEALPTPLAKALKRRIAP
jgi:acetolactate synthase-1/2/3 large subunit